MVYSCTLRTTNTHIRKHISIFSPTHIYTHTRTHIRIYFSSVPVRGRAWVNARGEGRRVAIMRDGGGDDNDDDDDDGDAEKR